MDLSSGTCRKEGEGYSYHEYDNPDHRHRQGVSVQESARTTQPDKLYLNNLNNGTRYTEDYFDEPDHKANSQSKIQ